MTDTIMWARLDDPAAPVSALAWPRPSYMYLERVPEAWLDEAERQSGLRLELLDPATQFQVWERGRVFCDTCELHWEKLAGAFQVVYVGPPANLPGFELAEDLDLRATEVRTRSYYLWGSRVSDEQLDLVGTSKLPDSEIFIELKVPRILRYPVSPQAGRVKVKVCEYVDPVSGDMVYYRFQGLEEQQL
ncbi:MAG: hypothetical protein KKA73_07125 [Chloroflexi bacterium]|nr:hypothetical protein [Chloroflexota bacterium]MBU1747442.1 hypothetical protein [Chloroflexota bacterium]